jgi:hypothetical protein
MPAVGVHIPRKRIEGHFDRHRFRFLTPSCVSDQLATGRSDRRAPVELDLQKTLLAGVLVEVALRRGAVHILFGDDHRVD